MKWKLHRTPFIFAFFLGALVVSSTLDRSAHAHELRVRGSAQFSADMTSAGTSLQIYGRLRDDLHQGLPQRRIHIRISSGQGAPEIEASTLTDFRGVFSWQTEVAPGIYTVDLVFPESEHVTAASLSRSLVIEAASVGLDLRVPRVVRADAVDIPLIIVASAGGAGMSGQVHIFLRDEPPRVVDLDRFGRARVNLRPDAEEGAQRVEVVLPATAHRDEVRAVASFHLSSSMTAEMNARAVYERFDRGIEVSGTVFDDHGPIRDVGVDVRLRRGPDDLSTADHREDRSIEVDARGRFRTVFSGPLIADGEWIVDVIVRPAAGSPLRISSDPVSIVRGSSRRFLHLLGLFGVLGALALLLSQVIREAWRRLQAKLEHRRAKRKRAWAFTETETIIPMTLPNDDADESSNAAHKFVLGGMVWDVWRERPVPRARLCLYSQDGESEPAAEIRSDGAGRFEFESMPAGRYRLVATAGGCVDGHMELSLPHRGRLRRFRLDLIAHPLKIRRVYQSMIAAFEEEDLWGRLTPQEIEDVLWATLSDSDAPPERLTERRAQLRHELGLFFDGKEQGVLDATKLLEIMTQLVEESYFGDKDLDAGVWLVARDIAMQLTDLAKMRGDRQ